MRVVIVEDSAQIMARLACLLSEMGQGVEVVGRARTAREAVRSISRA